MVSYFMSKTVKAQIFLETQIKGSALTMRKETIFSRLDEIK